MLRRTSSRASSRLGSAAPRRGLELRAAVPAAPSTVSATRAFQPRGVHPRTIQPPTPTEAARIARRLAEVSAAALMVRSATHTPVARYTTFNAMWAGHAEANSDTAHGARPRQCDQSGGRRSHSSHTSAGALRPTSSLRSPRRAGATQSESTVANAASELPTTPYRCTIDQVLPAPSNVSGFRVASDIDDEPSNEHLRALVELLVDPDAVGIEDVRLADFAAMTARRQLRAVGNDKECLEVVLGSEQYQACKDGRALRLAGISTVGEWHEHPDRVPVSAYTRGVLEQAYQRIIHRQQPAGAGSTPEAEVMAWLTRTIQKAVAAELVGGAATAVRGMPLLQAAAATPADVSSPPAPEEPQEEEAQQLVDVEDVAVPAKKSARTPPTPSSGAYEKEVVENDDGTITITEKVTELDEDELEDFDRSSRQQNVATVDDDGIPRWNGDIDVTGMHPLAKSTARNHTTKAKTTYTQEADAEDATAAEEAAPMDAEDKELDAEIARLLRETDEASAPATYVRGAADHAKSTSASSKRHHTKAAAAPVKATAIAAEEEAADDVEEIEEVEEVVEEEVEEDEAHVAAPAKTKAAASSTAAATHKKAPSAAALSPAKEARLARLAELMLTQVNSADGYLHLPAADLKPDVKDGTVEEVDTDVSQVSPLSLFSAYHAAPIDPAQDGERYPPEVIALKSIWDAYNTHQTALEEAEVSGDAAAAEFQTVKSVEALVQGALWLRCIAREEAVSMSVQEALPAFGFPLLSSDVRAFDAKRPRSSPYTNVSAQDVLDAAEAYRGFFRQKKETRFTPFRPKIDLNGGCNVVMLSGSTLHLYETSLKRDIQEEQVRLPFAEAMLGVLHILRDCHVLPRGVNTVHYHILVTQLPSTANADADMMLSGTTIVSVDLTGPFPAAEKKRLMALAEPLGLSGEMEEFECVEDIVRHVRETTNVNVIHDLLQNRDELEAMLTPTLVQLLPEDVDGAEEEEGEATNEDGADVKEEEEEEEAATADAEEEMEEVEEVEEVVEVEEDEEDVPPPPPFTSSRRRATAAATAAPVAPPARGSRKAQPVPEPELEEEIEKPEEVEEVEEIVEVEEIEEVEEEPEEVVVPPPRPAATRRRTQAHPAPTPAPASSSSATPKRTVAPAAAAAAAAPSTTSRWNLEEDNLDDVEEAEEAAPRVMTRHHQATSPRDVPTRVVVKKVVVKPAHGSAATPTARRAAVPPPPQSQPEEVDVEPEEEPVPAQWFNRKMKPKRKHLK